MMRLQHWVKSEASGLFYTTVELVKEEERQGHQVCMREPGGKVLFGTPFDDYDIDLIHSQFPVANYYNGKYRFLWCHGEPISSVGNGVSMRALTDLAGLCDAFICMRQEEAEYWRPIKRTYVVPKGIDLDRFKPLPVTDVPKLRGAPSVLYMEHWREYRNPLPLLIAFQDVWKEYPEARLHLANSTSDKMHQTFLDLAKHCKFEHTFLSSISKAILPSKVNALLNSCDIVVSCLDPLYARSIEAFGANKPLICPGYDDPEYPWHCRLRPAEMAKAIIDVWENGCGKFDFRGWAEKKHDVAETVRQSVAIYKRYMGTDENPKVLEFQRA